MTRQLSALAARYAVNAGWRQTCAARTTGRPVSIYDGKVAGMDTEGGRWQTVCEDHGYIVSHETIALARHHAPVPNEWCGHCMDPDNCPDEHCPDPYHAAERDQ